jgi:hypothetical protein
VVTCHGPCSVGAPVQRFKDSPGLTWWRSDYTYPASAYSMAQLALIQVPQNLSELRLVQLSDLTKREIIIGRLPLNVQTSVTEDWQSLYEAASNPTKWYRQPFVIIVVVRPRTPSSELLP